MQRPRRRRGRGGGAALLAYFPREKLAEDGAFFDAADELFEDPTPREVGGVASNDEELWFFEYRPKRREGVGE